MGGGECVNIYMLHFCTWREFKKNKQENAEIGKKGAWRKENSYDKIQHDKTKTGRYSVRLKSEDDKFKREFMKYIIGFI